MDNAFLRLKLTFEQAKTIGDPRQSKNRYYDSIVLNPNEVYLQITNSDVDIVFNGDYNVFLVDSFNNELAEITDKVYINEFTDIKGIRQIAFEIVKIGKTFNKNVFLKFVHTTGSNVFYSNPFVVSDDLEYTLRLDYSSYGVFQGTDYLNAPYVQSIRVAGQYEGLSDETENSTYIQSNSNKISQLPTLVFANDYDFNLINDFTYIALSVALKSDLVFVDEKRSTDKSVLKKGDREGNSNLYNCSGKFYFSDETYIANNQIAPAFSITDFYPQGLISLGENSKISLAFNIPVLLGVGNFRVFKENGTLIATLNQTDFILSGLIAQSVLVGSILDVNIPEKYFITFDISLFTTINNQTLELFDWNFEFIDGEYDSEDYNNNEYLT